MRWFGRQHELLHAFRNPGWFVERDGKRVALLIEPTFEDMFWFWWKVEPLSDDPDERASVMTPSFWTYDFLPRTEFVSREFGHVASAFWGGAGFQNGRILMRGLYQGDPTGWWDRFALRVLVKLGY